MREACSAGAYLREAVTITLAATSTSAVCGEIGQRLYGCVLGFAIVGGAAGFFIAGGLKLSDGLMRTVQRGTAAIALVMSLGMASGLIISAIAPTQSLTSTSRLTPTFINS